MKTMNIRFKLLLLVFLTAGLYGRAQTYEKSSSLSKAFSIHDETEVRIINKYGNIHLINWDEDSVRFEVKIKVTSSKKSKLDRTFDEIDIDFVESQQTIIAQTLFNSSESSFWQDVSDFANIIFKGGAEARIDYKVYLPENIETEIELKFGNLYTTDHSAGFSIDLSNGDLKAGNLNGNNKIKLNFGKASIDYFAEGRIETGYFDLEIDSLQKADIISKSSNLIIDHAGLIDLDSRRDKYHIGSLNTISGSASFSYINIKELNKEVVLHTNYGDVNVDKINPFFQLINIKADYTDIKIGIPEKVSFNVDLSFNQKTSIYIPEAIVGLEKETPVSDGNTIITGTFGDKAEPNAIFKVALMGGSLHLFKEK